MAMEPARAAQRGGQQGPEGSTCLWDGWSGGIAPAGWAGANCGVHECRSLEQRRAAENAHR